MGGGYWNDIDANNARYAIIEIEGASVVQTAGLPTNSVFPLGPTTNTFVVTDASGNSITCSFVVTVTDDELPNPVSKSISVTLAGGTASILASDIEDGSTDNCGVDFNLSSVSPNTFDCSTIGANAVVLSVTDVNGNSNTAPATVTVVGAIPSCNITSVPSNKTYTGGNANNIFLGYGAQSSTLSASAIGGSIFTYSWSGNVALLSNASIANPVFTPTTAGIYTFTLTVTNEFGCSSTCDITMNVVDARCGTAKNPKVLVCHNGHTICISPNAVPAHFSNHSGDVLGTCTSKNDGDIASTSAGILVYPNPTVGLATIEHTFNVASKGSIEVLDVNGRMLFGEIVELNEGEFSHTINLSNLPSGLYLVRLSSVNALYTERIELIK